MPPRLGTGGGWISMLLRLQNTPPGKEVAFFPHFNAE